MHHLYCGHRPLSLLRQVASMHRAHLAPTWTCCWSAWLARSGTLIVFSFNGFELSFPRFITVATSFFCLTVTVGSSIIIGNMVGPTKTLRNQQTIMNLMVTWFVIGLGVYLSPIACPLLTLFRPLFLVWLLSHLLYQRLPLLHLHAIKHAGEERCYPCCVYDCWALPISTHMQHR